jgi:hypothetical protein
MAIRYPVILFTNLLKKGIFSPLGPKTKTFFFKKSKIWRFFCKLFYFQPTTPTTMDPDALQVKIKSLETLLASQQRIIFTENLPQVDKIQN